MPTQTFFNLAEDKRKRIIDTLIEEFAEYSLSNASIARIIDKADIPRGSFYQYFTDIKDAYKYLFDVIVQMKLEYFQRYLSNFQELDTFVVIKQLYTEGLRFAHEQPKLAAIGNLFLKETEALKHEIFGEFEGRSTEFFQSILQQGQAKGEIDPNVDVEVAAFIFSSLNMALTDHYLMKTKHDNLFDNIDDFINVSNKMLYILENGIRSS